ncbi:MAG TPA: gliding motility-associated C-terminal domain-containing protein, partial [Chitinophagales bacterium]|nr:gliding motility-associated C-terminal domain-containing protein [Chitinophagales bacterium]
STASAGTTTYTFTPTAGQCATTTTMSITVGSNITPTFTQLGAYCVGQTPGTLATTSNNGITGTWNPSTVSTASAGTTTYTFTPTAGQCATTTTMSIVVNAIIRTSTDITICQGQSYTFNGQELTESGTYFDTLTSAYGCDSFSILNLTVTDALTLNIDNSICEGQSVTIGTQTFNASGDYTVVLQTTGGCDSIVHLHLVVNSPTSSQLEKTICEGSSYTLGSQTFDQSGNYTVHFTNSAGCDSSVYLNLTVNPVSRTEINTAICQGDTYTVGTQTFNQSGTYTVTLQNSVLCDSIITLNLSVNPTYLIEDTRTICEGDSLIYNGIKYMEAGTYPQHFYTSAQCDSIVNLVLQVTPKSRSTVNTTICSGQSYTIGTQTFNQSGTYFITLTAASSCDSIVTLNLTVNPPLTSTINKSICAGDSYTIGSQTFNASGTYTVTVQNQSGCDSIITLNLSVSEPLVSNINRIICRGEEVVIGDSTFTNAGMHHAILQSSAGCDSTVNLDLTVIDGPDVTISTSLTNPVAGQEFQLHASSPLATTFNWTPVSNVTSPTDSITAATIIETTWFYVTVTGSNTRCATTDSILIELKEIECTFDNLYIPNAFTPNGDEKNDLFIVRGPLLKSMSMLIYDRWGTVVFETNDLGTGWDGTYKGKLVQADVFGFIIRGECSNGTIITKKGNVTVLR